MLAFIKKEFLKEKNAIYIVFIIWWVFLIISFILSSSFNTKFDWVAKINPWIWGDSFWIINSLVSVITFFLVYKTFWLQKEMLDSQKDELEATRKELRWQKEIMSEWKFHEYFLFLMNQKELLKNTITKEIVEWINDTASTSHSESTTIRWEEVFYYWINEIKKANNPEYSEKSAKERKDNFNKIIWEWYRINSGKIKTYLNFISLIKEELEKQNNEKYIKLIPVIQSTDEYQVFNYIKDNCEN